MVSSGSGSTAPEGAAGWPKDHSAGLAPVTSQPRRRQPQTNLEGAPRSDAHTAFTVSRRSCLVNCPLALARYRPAIIMIVMTRVTHRSPVRGRRRGGGPDHREVRPADESRVGEPEGHDRVQTERQWAIAGTAMRAANMMPDRGSPISRSAVRSPGRYRGKGRNTVIQ